MFLACCKPIRWKRIQSLAVTGSDGNVAFWLWVTKVELGLIGHSVLRPKQKQTSRIDMLSNT